MYAHDVTDAELSDFIISALARRTHRGRGYWRRVIGGIVVSPEASGGCNWSLQGMGSADDAAQIEAIVAGIREDFPIVVKH